MKVKEVAQNNNGLSNKDCFQSKLDTKGRYLLCFGDLGSVFLRVYFESRQLLENDLNFNPVIFGNLLSPWVISDQFECGVTSIETMPV